MIRGSLGQNLASVLAPIRQGSLESCYECCSFTPSREGTFYSCLSVCLSVCWVCLGVSGPKSCPSVRSSVDCTGPPEGSRYNLRGRMFSEKSQPGDTFCLFQYSNLVPRLFYRLHSSTTYLHLHRTLPNQPNLIPIIRLNMAPQVLVLGMPRTGTQCMYIYPSPSYYRTCSQTNTILTVLTAIGEALGVLGYQNAYHMTTVGPNDHHDRWVAALEAKFEGKGTEFAKDEFDELFKGFDVST